MKYTFRRKLPTADTAVAGGDANSTSFEIQSSKPLNNETRCLFARRMGEPLSNMSRCSNISALPDENEVVLPAVYPGIYRLPSSIGTHPVPLSLSDALFGLNITLAGASRQALTKWSDAADKGTATTTPTMWWEVFTAPPEKYFNDVNNSKDCFDIKDHFNQGDRGIFFAVDSDKSIAVTASFLPQGGVTAFYLLLVGAFGVYVRPFFFNPIYNIPYTEIPHPEVLLEICEGVEIMRASEYEGHRKDEVGLYNFLLGVIKSSLMLRRITDQKQKKNN
jgi:hypothetical protein